MTNIPTFIESGRKFIIELVDEYPDVQKEIEIMFSEGGSASNVVSSLLTYIINGVVGFVISLIDGFVYIFTGLVFAIYMLCQKEHLVDGLKKIVYAYLNKRKANKIFQVGKLANKTFSNFISGQCVEAVILGAIMFVVSFVGGFPYALLIGVLTAVTALIPIVGAFIGIIQLILFA